MRASIVGTEFALTWEARGILWIRIPFILALIHVTITVGIDVCISWIEWIKVEVEFPSRPHSIAIMILVIDFRTVGPSISIGIG